MRLIDADKLRFRHTVKCNSNTTRPYTLNCISSDEVQNAPTIKVVPIDVLEQIRAEIQENINYNKKMNYQGIVAGLRLTLDIIDKYR